MHVHEFVLRAVLGRFPDRVEAHAPLLGWYSLEEAAVELLLDSLRTHAVLLDSEVRGWPPSVLLGHIHLCQLLPDAPLALLDDTVLVVATVSHLPVELGLGNFVVALDLGHLEAPLGEFDPDTAAIHAKDNLLSALLDPVDDHEEEQHATEAVDDLDAEEDVLNSVIELEVLDRRGRISLRLVLVHSFEVAEEGLRHRAVRRMRVGSFSWDVMRRCVEPLVALHLLFSSVAAKLVQAEDDLQQLQGVSGFAQVPVATFRDDEGLASRDETDDSDLDVDLSGDDFWVVLCVLEGLDREDGEFEKVDDVDDHHYEEAHEVRGGHAAAGAAEIQSHRYLHAVQAVSLSARPEHGGRVGARALQGLLDGRHPEGLRQLGV